MAEPIAPPPGLEQFLNDEPVSGLNPAPVAVPKISAPFAIEATPPPGLEEFVNPQPSFLQRQLDDQFAVNRPMTEDDQEEQDFFNKKIDHRNLHIPESIKATLEGGANAMTLGGYSAIAAKSGFRTPEEQRYTREKHELAYNIGQAGGVLAYLAGGEGLGVFGLAGSAVEGAGAVAGNLVTNRVASVALKAAAETMMIQGGDEVAKHFIQDPHQTLQTAAVNIGLSGLLGAGIGVGTDAVIGKVSSLWKARNGAKTEGVLKDVLNEASNAEEYAAMRDAGTLIEVPPKPGELPPTPDVLLGEAGKDIPKDYGGILSSGPERPNADLVRQAAADNGLKLGPEALLENAQAGRDALSKRPSVAGVQYNKELKKIHAVTENLSKEALAEQSTLSKYDAGGKIIDEILEPLKKEGEVLQERFQKMEPVLENIEASPELKAKAVQTVLDNKLVKIAPELEALATKTAKQIQGIDNLVTLKQVRTYINGEIDNALPALGAKDTNRAGILLSAKNALTQLEESSIAEAAAKSGIGKKGANDVTSQMVDELQALRRDWAAHKTNLRETGQNLGVGDMYSAKTAEAKLFKPGLKDEAFVKKVLDPDNVGVMKFMQEKYPKAFETARQYKLKELHDTSLSGAMGEDGKFLVGSFLNKVRKMSPEAKEAVFGSPMLRKIRDAELLYFGALPKNYNPSGTAAAISWGDFLSLKGLGDNAADGLKWALMKGVPMIKAAIGGGASSKAVEIAMMQAIKSGAPVEAGSFKALVQYVEHALQGDAEIAHLTQSVFEAGSLKLPNVIVSDKSREQLNEKLKSLQEDPSPLIDVGGDTAHYAPDHGTAMGQTASMAVNYLNSLRPNTTKALPFDSDPKPDPVKQADFNRALDVAQKPLIALEGIKQGRVSSKDLKTLQMVYPALHSKITDKLNQNMIDTLSKGQSVPYATRIGVSIFSAQPLDSSMKPESIRAAQPKAQNASPQQQQLQAQRSGPRSFKALDKIPGQFQTPGQAREATRIGGGRHSR